jgi:hypothetical protein
LQALGANAEHVRIEGSGSNALDFHIAYYIGRLVTEFAGASFYAISNDAGFDPLVKHLASHGVDCRRLGSICAACEAEPVISELVEDRLSVVLNYLAKVNERRPRTLTTLTSTIKSLHKNLSRADAA